MRKVLYISDLDDTAPIFHSQVIPHVNELKKFFDVALMILRRNPKTKSAHDDVFYYDSVKGDYFYYLARINFLKQKKKVRAIIKPGKFELIYSRGIRGGIVGY